jgi:hypothetical protein
VKLFGVDAFPARQRPLLHKKRPVGRADRLRQVYVPAVEAVSVAQENDLPSIGGSLRNVPPVTSVGDGGGTGRLLMSTVRSTRRDAAFRGRRDAYPSVPGMGLN